MDRMIEDVLRIEAEALARYRKITDADRVLRVMKRTAMDCRGERFHENRPGRDPLEHGLGHNPSLDEALAYLPPEEALDLFEKVNLDELIVKITTVAYWLDARTPFYTRQELAQLIMKFREYLDGNRSCLISIGYPSKSFERSHWLYSKLSRLYPLKLPSSVRGGIPLYQDVCGPLLDSKRDSDGNWIFEYKWVKERQAPPAPVENLTPCSYEEAPPIEGVTDEVIRHIEEQRSRFFNLKMRILDIAHTYLTNIGRYEDFWYECIQAMSDVLSVEEFNLLNETEEIYNDLFLEPGLSSGEYLFILANPISGIAKDLDAGGIKNLIEFIFFVEEELKIGKMHYTKGRFQDLVGEPEPVSYYQLVSSPIIEDIDKIVFDYLTYHDYEKRFAEMFNSRLDQDVERKFKTPLLVSPGRYDAIKAYAEFVEQNYKLGIDIVGRFVTPMLRNKTIQPISVPAGTRWEDIKITFLDGHNVRIRCGDMSLDANYKEMGFEDRRTHRPDVQWQLLEQLAESGGTIDWKDSGATRRLKKRKQLLSQSLKAYFQINEDPFSPYKQEKAYQIRIRLATSY